MMRTTTGENALNNLPTISVAKLSAVLIELDDHKPTIEPEGPTTNYSFGRRGTAKVMLAIKGTTEGGERLTRVVLVLGPDDLSAKIAAMLGLPSLDDRTSFEFCDTEGERLDVYAPRLSSIEDSATIVWFLRLPQAA